MCLYTQIYVCDGVYLSIKTHKYFILMTLISHSCVVHTFTFIASINQFNATQTMNMKKTNEPNEIIIKLLLIYWLENNNQTTNAIKKIRMKI